MSASRRNYPGGRYMEPAATTSTFEAPCAVVVTYPDGKRVCNKPEREHQRGYSAYGHAFEPQQTKATFDAIQAVENGICTDDDLKTVLALRTVQVEIEGRHYPLALLSRAIQAAWRYAIHRGGPDWALEDLEWREKNGI